jgi:D-3-phosphoglycerate dehydrogenase
MEIDMKPVIVTTSPVFGKMGEVSKFIAAKGWELVRCADNSRPDGGVSEYIDRMDFLVVGLLPATAEQMRSAPKLKGILKNGVGVDNIDIPAATACNIPVLNTPGANANAVAELAVGGMFSLARHLPMAHMDLRNKLWKREVGTEIAGKTLGIVGFGNIGKTLALKALALGMRVMASDLYPDTAFAATHGVTLTDIKTILQEADYISLHIFGGKENEHLIGKAELAIMKPTACVMNYARGEVLDLDALDSALRNNVLGGAAIDAYVVEPPDFSHPIFDNPKVAFTPHSGADTRESSERVGMMVVEDIESLLNGEHPSRVLNPEIFAYTKIGETSAQDVLRL